MLVSEGGPLDIFARMRGYFATKQKKSGGLFDLISCFFCTSVWVGAIFALFVSSNLLTFFIYTFILSGIASIIQELINKHK